MSLLGESISALVAIKIKRRYDTFTDQYNRIFMVKMTILFSAFIGFNYFQDKVSCIVANVNGMDGGFVGSACWIQGFYVFDEMRDRLDESGYYGIPKNMDYDGINPLGQLCSTVDRALDKVTECRPMQRLYYLQYQYMPFFTASLAFFFYLPYILFKTVNFDIISLRDEIKDGEMSADKIFTSYFDRIVNNRRRMRYKSILNIIIKLMYLIANVLAFEACDSILHGDFRSYGTEFAKWVKYENFERHDHNLKVRAVPKPGNILLPPMGFCDIHEASRDVRNTHINTHRFICEISPHVLYQYVMLVFWFLLVIGIVISILGFFQHIMVHIASYIQMNRHDPTGKLYRVLTLREIDYLDILRLKSTSQYGTVLKKIREDRLDHVVDETEKLYPGKDTMF